MNSKMGVSGSIARLFVTSKLTPLIALLGMLLGIFAILVTPREEEPQINVTFANIFIPFPGASSKEVEQLVTSPAEQILSEITGVKHIYSASRPGMSVLTVRYNVGEDRTQAIVRLYNAIYSNQDWLPANLGVGQPVIKPKGIDDVPILTLTLWTEDETRGAFDLQQVAHTLETELKRVEGTRDIYTVGSLDQVVHVLLDPVRLSGYHIAIDDLRRALVSNNFSYEAGSVVRNNNEIPVQAGMFYSNINEIADLIVGVSDNAPVYLRDVAEIRYGPDQPEQYVWIGMGPAADNKGVDARGSFPAVTIAVAKKPGSNAVDISNKLLEKVEQLKGVFIPEGVQVTVTRNYGQTADDKAEKLISKLVLATVAVVVLVLFSLGVREAFIVGVAIIITLMITLFASWAWGFSINRVSLFALIFSIGILVDDAIVVVENIHRHISIGGKTLLDSIPLAVDEVGGPTILATFTVIASLLPMAFVSGLMGPYMSPIPINASIGMLISLGIAFIVTPWMAYKVLVKNNGGVNASVNVHKSENDSGIEAGHDNNGFEIFRKIIRPFLDETKGRSRRWMLFGGVLLLMFASVSLGVFKFVVLKMLPFDNKSELQLIVDMPEGTALERTARVLSELGDFLATVPEVTNYQVYAGNASPINFNGLVRQYYLREGHSVGDIQINLVDKSQRERRSHEIAVAIRKPLQDIGLQYDANVKIVEVPPGPPVQSPLVADYVAQQRTASIVRKAFDSVDDVVDVDESIETAAEKFILKVDKHKAGLAGISQQQIANTISTVLKGEDVSYLHETNSRFPVAIRLEFAVGDKSGLQAINSLSIRGNNNRLYPMSDFISVQSDKRDHVIYHKDLLPVVFVTADAAGELDSPLYGMFDILFRLQDDPDASQLDQYLLDAPDNIYRDSLKWDGEWQITYETFRDMGIAYLVGIIFIYLLVVSQFRSYSVPLVIMAPIPLTMIGVMPGHLLMGEQYTATSMIGMIALAGLIVRNSILLVDFINQQTAAGEPMKDAVINASVIRAKPIFLTGFAAILGALFIIDDPIFSGLAVSLIFGILVSMLLTLLLIPVMFFAFYQHQSPE